MPYKDKEKAKENNRKKYLRWKEKDIDGLRAYWRKKNKERYKKSSNKKEARRKIRFKVLLRDKFACTYCGKKPPETTLEIDHIFPRSKGGTDNIENLTTSCHECNQGKKDLILSNLPIKKD